VAPGGGVELNVMFWLALVTVNVVEPMIEDRPALMVDPIAAFRAFEAWYESERGQPFLMVFERYVPPTPLVEF